MNAFRRFQRMQIISSSAKLHSNRVHNIHALTLYWSMLVFLPNTRVSAIICYCASTLALFHVSECSLLLPGMLKSSSLRVEVKTVYNTAQKQRDFLVYCYVSSISGAWIILTTCWCERKFNNIRRCFSLMMPSFRRKACKTQLESSSSSKKLLSSSQRKNEHTFYSEAAVCKRLWTGNVFSQKKFSVFCVIMKWGNSPPTS